MIRTLRWLLVAPMAAFGWFMALTGALALHSLIFEFCPVEFKISGVCVHEWAFIAEDGLVLAGGFVAAVFVVSFATRTAPAFKSQVATTVFLIGLGVAIWAYLETHALEALLGACIGGIMTLLLIVRKHGWRRASNFRQYELFI